jgi:hypothetical protein
MAASMRESTSIEKIVKRALIGKIVRVTGSVLKRDGLGIVKEHYDASGKVENVEFYDSFEYWVLTLEGDKEFTVYHDDLIEIADGS